MIVSLFIIVTHEEYAQVCLEYIDSSNPNGYIIHTSREDVINRWPGVVAMPYAKILEGRVNTETGEVTWHDT